MNRFFAIAIFVTGCLFLSPRVSASESDHSTTTIKMGVYMVELQDFDPKLSSFQADFWLWAVTPSHMENWIQTLDYPSGIQLEKLNTVEQPVDGKLWVSTNVQGQFRQDWQLKNFPFDRPHLQIQIEETTLDASSLQFSADTINSTAKECVFPTGWRLKAFTIRDGIHHYGTNFGNPSKTVQSNSEYSKLKIDLEIERESYAIFLKMTAIPYIATMLVFLSFFLV